MYTEALQRILPLVGKILGSQKEVKIKETVSGGYGHPIVFKVELLGGKPIWFSVTYSDVGFAPKEFTPELREALYERLLVSILNMAVYGSE